MEMSYGFDYVDIEHAALEQPRRKLYQVQIPLTLASLNITILVTLAQNVQTK